jgi:chromate transporter
MGSHISPATTPFIENPSFRDALAVWAKIGVMSFGGPAGQIVLMHRNLVDERRWIAEDRFLHGLNFCMLLPGPEAMQLATYIGWRLPRASSLCCPEPRSCSP